MTSPLNGDLTKQFTKIATVSNKPSSKGTVSYKDSKGLQGASYYCYQIVPVNGKKKGAASTMLAGGRTCNGTEESDSRRSVPGTD